MCVAGKPSVFGPAAMHLAQKSAYEPAQPEEERAAQGTYNCGRGEGLFAAEEELAAAEAGCEGCSGCIIAGCVGAAWREGCDAVRKSRLCQATGRGG